MAERRERAAVAVVGVGVGDGAALLPPQRDHATERSGVAHEPRGSSVTPPAPTRALLADLDPLNQVFGVGVGGVRPGAAVERIFVGVA